MSACDFKVRNPRAPALTKGRSLAFPESASAAKLLTVLGHLTKCGHSRARLNCARGRA